tara:strand:- start:55 stop:822 length:768 start_codon:yes stop_codon:yes gene_type:complete
MDNENNEYHAPVQWQTQSTEINELAGALSLAQGEMNPAKKGASNPFFKSKYADLSEIIEATRYPLTGNDLSIVQYCEDGYVVTQLMHGSGQWIRGRLRITPKENTPQGIGSALTYARRYSWQMMCGLGAEDDDGESAMGRAGSAYDPAHAKPPARKKATPKRKPEPIDDGKGNSKVATMEQEEKEVALKKPAQVAEPDEVEAILNAISSARDFLKHLDCDPDNLPDTVKDRILSSGVDGFGEKVAQWKLSKEEKE